MPRTAPVNLTSALTAAMKRTLIFEYRCACCWGNLITDGEDGPVVCAAYPEHQGYVTLYYVEKRRERSSYDLAQVKQMIEDTPDLRELFGFGQSTKTPQERAAQLRAVRQMRRANDTLY
jgi:hypothetical protein